MFAIVETGGKQYKVAPGNAITVERLVSEPGATVDLDRVLMIGDDGGSVKVGNPFIAGAKVRAHVLGHERGEKIVVFKYKAKVNYRRRTGHRQEITRIRVTDILPQ
jgi:large subunit ribosomal protein L21